MLQVLSYGYICGDAHITSVQHGSFPVLVLDREMLYGQRKTGCRSDALVA